MDYKQEIQLLKSSIDDLKKEINDLQNQIYTHEHNGINGSRIQLDDIQNTINIISTVPTHTPRDFFEQFYIYKNGSTYRFYWHDGVGWRYATGT